MEISVKRAENPLSKTAAASRYSIAATLKEVVSEEELSVNSSEEDLPASHFTETDLQEYWQTFLNETRAKDIVISNAISGFTLKKLEEDLIEVTYPSLTAKAEFDKVYGDFLSGLQYDVQHYHLKIEYKSNSGRLKIQTESQTKRSKFEEYCEINPLLRELDEIFKLDFN